MRERSRIVSRPTGALLVTGPTGSGKSTTLYAALAAISRPEINVITVEDPVEYRLGGIKQIQINRAPGSPRPRCARSSAPTPTSSWSARSGTARQRISIEAALTGHLVLSTLHTNDAPAALTRLNEMGVEPFITGAAVSAVLAQRSRASSPHCAVAYEPGRGAALRCTWTKRPWRIAGSTFRRKMGCPRCGNTEHRGGSASSSCSR